MEINRPYARLSKEDAAVLLVDHQAGLLSLVQDFPPAEFRNNVMALAEVATYFELPTILSTSFEDGPNGPILSELPEMHPEARMVRRPGEINAWDNPEFVQAVKDTGRKQLIIAGIVTDICVQFPTLSALAEGYEVFVVVDASGTMNKTVRDAAWMRMQAAGAQLMGWFNIAAELHRDWRNDVEGLGTLITKYVPNYQALMTSFLAQQR